MTRRRALLARVEKSPSEYVMDGLVFWLDGINKGDGASNQWIDLVGGKVFALSGEYRNEQNGVYFSYGIGSFEGSVTSNWESETIEIVCSGVTDNSVLFIQPLTSGGISAVQRTNQIVICADANNHQCFDVNAGCKCISANKNLAIADGVNCTLGGNVSFRPYQTSTNISRRIAGDNQFVGTIHAIRIYNRHLTAQEMLSNQQIDNTRFGLGL